MPVEIQAGESIRFDVAVLPLPKGEAELKFDLYVDANNTLFTDPVYRLLRFVDSQSLNGDGDLKAEAIVND